MPHHFVLQRQLLFLEPVEQVLVGMRSDLFRLDARVKRFMFACECLDVGLVHQILLGSIDDSIIKPSFHEDVASPTEKIIEELLRTGANGGDGYDGTVMNDDDPAELLAALKAEHRRLDEEIERMIESGQADQIELARLKKRKLVLKDQIAAIEDDIHPDIIA